ARDLLEDGTPLVVRAGEVADADQKRAGDLAACEDERAAKELHPFVFAQRVMRIKPRGERRGHVADAPRVLDGRFDLQPVTNDAGVAQQAIGLHPRDAVDVEVAKCFPERVALFQNGQPRQAGLIDLQHQPLEQRVVVLDRKSVLAIVIRAVKGMAGRDVAVAHASMVSGGAATQNSSAATRTISATALASRSGRSFCSSSAMFDSSIASAMVSG